MSTGTYLVQKANVVAAATVQKAKLIPKRPSFWVVCGLALLDLITNPLALAVVPKKLWYIRFVGYGVLGYRQLRDRKPDLPPSDSDSA